MSEAEIIQENQKRLSHIFSAYDPFFGIGSPIERFPLKIRISDRKEIVFLLPVEMRKDELTKLFIDLSGDINAVTRKIFNQVTPNNQEEVMRMFIRSRFKYDFEFWALLTVKIQDKISKGIIPFKMRMAQRILFKELEEMRMAKKPIRLILLKSRQYGGSTLIQMYMLWIQTQLKENWHSAICADVEDQARNIRGMFARAAKEYPGEVGAITLLPYQGSAKNKMIRERGCIIGIGSMQKPDNLRSYDFSMLHLSEVGLFKETEGRKPEDLTQTLRSALPSMPLTLEVLESTAKGVGNFFHREWLDAKNKVSGYKACFVPWFIIDMYLKRVDDYSAFIKSLSSYEKYQWEIGATLEGIYWYRMFKSDNRYSDWRMAAEFPGTDIEAFQSTGARVFAPDYVQLNRHTCCEPEFKGKLFARSSKGADAFKNIKFEQTPDGNLWVWALPDNSIEVENRYIVTVDIGGRTDTADFSTIRVLDRYWSIEGGVPEMVATWRGHLDQDLFSWVAAQVAAFYNNALLIMETNSLRKEKLASGGDHYLTILNEIAEFYDNIFTRMSPEKVNGNPPVLYGLHMGSNKVMIIDAYNGALRDQGYVERDRRVLDEADCYEFKPDGTMGATDGMHDDLVIVSAMAVWAHYSPIAIGPVKEVKQQSFKKKSIISEASI